MTIFILAPPEFYLMKKCCDKNDAKTRDFEMAVKTLFVFEKKLVKVLMSHKLVAFELRNEK